MNNQVFEKLLKNAELSKKDFSKLVGMNYNSVTNWNKSNKIPNWVESWLKLFIENKDYKELKEAIKKTICEKKIN